MGGGSRQPGPLGAGPVTGDPRGPEGLAAGSNAAQALPPPVPDYGNTVDRKAYSWMDGKAQILLCRLAEPKPDFSWTLSQIRKETGRNDQLGFTDCVFLSEPVANKKAEAAGYFCGRAALKTVVIRLPKELDVTDAQIQAAERKTDPKIAKKLKALRACKGHLLAHELKHVENAWASLSDASLGWYLKLGCLSSDAVVTSKLVLEALDGADAMAPTAIAESGKKWDDDDLGRLSGEFHNQHIFVDPGENAEFLYIEQAGEG